MQIDAGTIAGDAGELTGGTAGDGAGEPVRADGGDTGGLPKRGRGRPRKSDSAAAGEPAARVNPAELGSAGGSEPAGRERTAKRERARSSDSAKKASPLPVEVILSALVVSQISLIAATSVPEFGLSEAQNDLLAKALANCSRHYAPEVSEKTRDHFALGAAVAQIGFAQAVAYRQRKKQEGAARPNVVPMPQHMGGGIG